VVSELPALTLDKIDFDYRIEGDETRFKPLRAFNDGSRVYLQMPDTMKSDEAPVLLLMDKDDQPLLVNYRVKDAYYIVDKLFDRAMLIVGTEGSQSKVSITWMKRERKGWLW
jgi:type IV secretion system protein VirB9